jgi:hypothetical protein
VGAWLDVLDGLARSGLRPSRSATTREVVGEAGAAFGATVALAVGQVGAVAERALFSSAAIEPADAEMAWAACHEVRRAVRSSLDWRGRLAGATALRRTRQR